MKKSLTLRDVLDHRGAFYGLAALWILFYHMKLSIPDGTLFLPVQFVHLTGTAGADMFAMLSAFGLWHSLRKNPDLRRFYLRRLQRVALPTLIAVVAFGVLLAYPLRSVLCMLPIVTYWFGCQCMWFPAYILLMYLIYPGIFALQQKRPKAVWGLFAASVALAALPSLVESAYLNHVILGVERIPAFLLGCILAPKQDDETPIPRWVFPGALGAYLLLSLTLRPLVTNDPFPYFAGCFLLSVCVFLAGARLFGWCASGKLRRAFLRILTGFGGVSLELYLCYNQIEDLLRPFVASVTLRSLCAAALSMLCAWLLRALCLRLTTGRR